MEEKHVKTLEERSAQYYSELGSERDKRLKPLVDRFLRECEEAGLSAYEVDNVIQLMNVKLNLLKSISPFHLVAKPH